MARLKKANSHYDKTVVRLAALKSIDPAMDLGNGLTVAIYNTGIVDLGTKLEDYNTTLSLVDEKLNIVQAPEKMLKDISERMLVGVASKFGKNSDEYEKAGGIKKSERKKRKSKPAA